MDFLGMMKLLYLRMSKGGEGLRFVWKKVGAVLRMQVVLRVLPGLRVVGPRCP